MFDCVLPTRLGRHGTAFSSNWNIKLKNACHFSSNEPIDRNCNCYVCKNYSRSYLHHLVKENEMLAGTLISLHNIAYLHQLVEKEREFKI
jgi:queuine tRNA-ribosyltransferase